MGIKRRLNRQGKRNTTPKAKAKKKSDKKADISPVINEITSVKQIHELELHQIKLEMQNKAILDNIPDIAWLKDRESRYIAINEALENSIGLRNADVVGKTDLDFFPLDLAEHYRTDDMEVMKSGKRKQIEEYYIDKDGRKIWLETIKTPIFNKQNEVIGTTGIARDITDRKELQDTLRILASDWQQTFDAINDGIVLIDKNNIIQRVNKAVTNIIGMRPSETIGRLCWEVFHKTNFPIHDCPFTVVKDTNKREGIAQLFGNKWFEVIVDPLFDNIGDLIGSVHIIMDITERKQKENELLESEERFRSTFEQAAVGIAHVAPDGTWLRMNRKLCDIVGYTYDELIKLTFQDITFADDLDVDLEFVRQVLADEIKTYTLEKQYIRKDGSTVWIELTVSLVRDPEGKPDYFISVINDISVRKAAQEEMKRLSMSVEQATEAIIITDTEGKIDYVNSAAQHITGYNREELIGSIPSIFKPEMLSENFYRGLWETINSGNSFTEIIKDTKKNGEPYYLLQTIRPLKDKSGKIINFITTGKDITQQKAVEQKLNYLIYNDALTGIPNRIFYTERLEREIARAAYDGTVVATVIIDIDRFKYINDANGNAFGDKVLKTIAERLSASVRKGDIVARLGSDEFGLILIDIKRSEDIIHFIDKLMNNISMPIEEESRLTISGGISLYPNDGASVEVLLKSADIALLKSKKEGGNNIQFVATEMTIKASEFALMEKRLIKALKENEFVMHYQPYWDVKTKVMTGMEALIRWQSKDLGLVPPVRFISILEETGLIIDVGKWILKKCCSQLREWLNKGYKAVPVSINFSSIQFRQKDLLETITATIEESDIDPHLITMEITESAIMEDPEFTNSVLNNIKQQGISISIDDFGTGYSSLSYLRRFPIDNLKIDISFIRDLSEDPDTASIVTAIIGMAHTLGLKTIAEGIETEEQWKILRLLRCDLGQGFYYSKPLPAMEVETFFTKAG